MTDRYYSELPIAGETITLSGPEAHHLVGVMRRQPGEQVTLFDGSGAEFVAEIAQHKRGTVTLRVVERREVDRELARPLILGVALPKGERQRWLLEKIVELGVTQLVPLACERSVAEAKDGALARLRRGVIEASKQCGRNRLMEITEPLPLADFLASASAAAQRLFAHPTGALLELEWSPATTSAADGDSACGSGTYLAIGPEGGFADAELAAAAAAGWRIVTLGPSILRVETAAILLAGLAAHQFRSAGPGPGDR